MKPVLLIVGTLIFLLADTMGIVMATEQINRNLNPQKFKVTYQATYNAQTLEEAAKLEKAFREQNKDSCTIQVQIEPVDSLEVPSSGTIFWSPTTR